MKKIAYFLASILFLISCQSSHEESNQMQSDSTKTENTSSEWILNDLLTYKDINALKEKFGEKNVVTDTLWGEEGMFDIGTKLFPGTANEVEIMWHDVEKQADMRSALIRIHYNDNIQNFDLSTKWRTKEGVYLGMPLEELVKLNGKPIKFYGFGWDYGGDVSSFEDGLLQGKMNISLMHTADDSSLSEKEILHITGEKTLSTENNDLSKYKIKVAIIEVYSKE